MEERRGSNPLLTWPALVLLATMLGGVYYIPQRLQPSRPDEKPASGRAGLGDEGAPARLWQDPFEVIERYEAAARDNDRNRTIGAGRGATSTTGLADFANLIPRYVGSVTTTSAVDAVEAEPPKRNPPASILGVMVSGESYTEDAEVRRRSRHAVVSALGRAGYIPKSENRMGYFRVPWPRGSEIASMSLEALRPLTSLRRDQSLVVPFEWFEQSSLNPPRPANDATSGPVAVLWLNSSAFEDFPQRRLAQLLDAIQRAVPPPAGDTQHSNSTPAMTFTILNPSLSALLHEPPGPAPDGVGNFGNHFAARDILRGTRLISSWSTSADALLLPTNSDAPRLAISNHLAASGMQLINATCTDDQLACELIDELKLREVDLTGVRRDAVAILSDSDTFYGRALPLTFAATLSAQCARGSNSALSGPSVETFNKLRTDPDAWPKHLFSYSYLRGIDGKLPTEPKAAGGTDGKGGRGSTQDLERPEGQSQMDYLPRLAATLKERDLELRRTDKRGLRAIGVLGSDVYDKLLVLQSLHKLFPDVIFFTTDLDARLLHPRELDWTRNMVVASSYGLSLHRDLQGAVPPFRDTYQAALFLATLAAVNDRHVTPGLLANMAPRRFEIGRRGAYDISTTTATNLHPPRANTFQGTTPGAVFARGTFHAVALGLLLSILFVSLWRFKERGPRRSAETPDHVQTRLQIRLERVFQTVHWMKVLTWIGASAAVFALIGGIWASHLDARGEPFSLIDGISIWPGTLLRMAAACLSLWLLGQARISLRSSKRRLADEFGMQEVPNDMSRDVAEAWAARKESRLKNWWARAWAYRRWIGIRSWTFEDVKIGNQVDARRLWADYNRKGWLLHRSCRFAVPALIYVVFSMLLIQWTGEIFVPNRGPSSQFWHSVTLTAAVTLQIILTFYVVDATRLCCRLVEIQMEHSTRWSRYTCSRFGDRSGIHDEYLSDWIDINFIAQRTRDVDRLIYYPFAVLFLMIMARLPFFDRWTWPLSLIIVMGLNSLIALLSVYRLRVTAEKARSFALERLNTHLVTAMGRPEESDREQAAQAGPRQEAVEREETPAPREIVPAGSGLAAPGTPGNPGTAVMATSQVETQAAVHPEASVAQLRWMIDEIKAMRTGAFAPIAEQPVLRAILMPLGGGGLVALLEMFGR